MATRRTMEGQFGAGGEMTGPNEPKSNGHEGEGMGERLRHRAGEMVEERKEQVASGIDRASDKLEERANTMDEGGGMSRRAGRAMHKASDMLEEGAEYLHTKPVSTIRDDITDQIREHPYVSVGVALGTGFLLGRALGGGEEEEETEHRRFRGRMREMPTHEQGMLSAARPSIGRALAAGLGGVLANQVRRRVGGR